MDFDKDGAIATRALMLRELNHRAKNMLQLIASILTLERSRTKNEEARAAIARAAGRLQMMSHVHSMLYLSGDGTERIQMKPYLHALCQAISKGLYPAAEQIACSVACEDLYWPMETAGQVGMIVAEALINSCKHAFLPSDTATLAVRLSREGANNFQLEISDNGKGYNPGDTSQGVGTALLRSFAQNLNGKFEVISRPGAGTRVMLSFPLAEAGDGLDGQGEAHVLL
jgi:two-component sensor histidine kinase